MYNVNLEYFQGPLDLLLHLIEKLEVDIYNIPIAELTEGYLNYINSVDRISLESAEEYIVMASTLIHIKSKTLLPIENDDQVDYIEEEFFQKLIDYKNYKLLGEELNYLQSERVKFIDKESVVLDELVNIKDLKMSSDNIFKALENMLKNKRRIEDSEEDVLKYRKEISIDSVKNGIMAILKNEPIVDFKELFNDYQTREEIVVVFITILDMIKDNLIICEEKEDRELYIKYMR